MQRTAMAILGHEADARNSVAASLAAIWRELPRLRDPLAFDAWSTRIVVHACRRRLRGVGPARVRELTIDAAEAGRTMPSAAGPADDVAERMALEQAFDRLDADARTILVLHHLDGRGLAEVAGDPGNPGRDDEVAAVRGPQGARARPGAGAMSRAGRCRRNRSRYRRPGNAPGASGSRQPDRARRGVDRRRRSRPPGQASRRGNRLRSSSAG